MPIPFPLSTRLYYYYTRNRPESGREDPSSSATIGIRSVEGTIKEKSGRKETRTWAEIGMKGAAGRCLKRRKKRKEKEKRKTKEKR